VIDYSEKVKFGIVGRPLVGNEVIEHEDRVAPLSIFQEVSKLRDVMVWPVGSKGILYELNQMFENVGFSKEKVVTEVDITKSAGPASCYIVAYLPSQESELKRLAGGFFHTVEIER
jgi:hypothetical protein